MKKLLPEAMVICGLVITVTYAFAQTWTKTTAPQSEWENLTASADGRTIIAVDSSTIAAVSTNSGATWTQNAVRHSFSQVASSADGTKMIAFFSSVISYLYVSTNSGYSWAQSSAPQAFWVACASSADGTKLIAAAHGNPNYTGGQMYYSTNSGATWQTNGAPDKLWVSVVSSADGTKLAAATDNDCIYTSTNAGMTWTPTPSPSIYWSSIATSADGKQLIATGSGNGNGGTYISTDYGNSWLSNSATAVAVASSADGSKLILSGGYSIFTSTNFGIDWVSNNVPFKRWIGVASSADGCLQLALRDLGGIWICRTPPSPQLNMTSLAINLNFSWIVPSTNFVLQQSPDLILWSNVTNLPVLNFSNLNNELTLSPSNASGFFRLISQ